jgi:thioredoxin reductase (NADPH)
MLKMRCHVVDALDTTGGQCAALYPEKPIFDIPAYPRIDAAELIRKLEEQVAPFHPTYHLGQQVESLTPADGGGWIVATTAGTRIACKAVAIAAGVGAFGPNRPPLAGIEQYEGRSVFYLVKQREDFRGKRIVIAGGGDSAVDWTLLLAELAAKLYVIHRRPKFARRRRAWPASTRWPRTARSRWWCPISWRAWRAATAGSAWWWPRSTGRSAGWRPTCCCPSSASP